MIKVIIGTQTPGSTLIKSSDKALITSGETGDALTAMIRLIQQVGSEMNPDIQNLLSRISTSDIATYTDYLCLANYLQKYRIGIILVDVIQEIGEEDDSSLTVLMMNQNSNGLIKAGVMYHTNVNDVDMTKIFEDTKERYRLFPESLYPDAALTTKLESLKTLQQVGGVVYQNDKDDIATLLARLGFKAYFITR